MPRPKCLLAENITVLVWSHVPASNVYLAHRVRMGRSLATSLWPHLLAGAWLFAVSKELLLKHYKWQETRVLQQSKYTHELYNIRAHLLYYSYLLKDAIKTVEFISRTKNPAMHSDEKREESDEILQRECSNLSDAIMRLEQERSMQDQRLGNVMKLVSLSNAQ